jgi:CheY-like chemotaxis protein
MPNRTILLVEDDEILNQMIGQMLESNGFLVLRASNGEEALALFEADIREITLVVSDIEMPRMSGVELRDRLRKQSPQLKIFLMSATFPETQILSSQLGSYDRFIAKPFDIVTFLSIIEAFISA